MELNMNALGRRSMEHMGKRLKEYLLWNLLRAHGAWR
jgi:hypothetical protein